MDWIHTNPLKVLRKCKSDKQLLNSSWLPKLCMKRKKKKRTQEKIYLIVPEVIDFIFIHSQVKWWMDEFIIIWINYFRILWFESPQPGSLNTHEFNLYNHNTGFPLYLQVSTRKYIAVIIYQKYRQHREHRFHCSKWSVKLILFLHMYFGTISDMKLLDFFCVLFVFNREKTKDRRTSEWLQNQSDFKKVPQIKRTISVLTLCQY